MINEKVIDKLMTLPMDAEVLLTNFASTSKETAAPAILGITKDPNENIIRLEIQGDTKYVNNSVFKILIKKSKLLDKVMNKIEKIAEKYANTKMYDDLLTILKDEINI